MFEEAIKNITAAAVMINDVPYAPIGLVLDELEPVVIASGILLGVSLWIAMQVLDLICDVGSLVIYRIKARRESKAVEKLMRDDPAFAAACEALDKVDSDNLKKLLNSRKATKSE